MLTPRQVLTPDSLAMLKSIDHLGSFAAAARSMGLVPSALSYRVRQIARQHIADDFHVLVAMGAKTGTWGDAVFVDHPQIAPTHELRVLIARKRKTVEGLQPTVVGIASVL